MANEAQKMQLAGNVLDELITNHVGPEDVDIIVRCVSARLKQLGDDTSMVLLTFARPMPGNDDEAQYCTVEVWANDEGLAILRKQLDALSELGFLHISEHSS